MTHRLKVLDTFDGPRLLLVTDPGEGFDVESQDLGLVEDAADLVPEDLEAEYAVILMDAIDAELFGIACMREVHATFREGKGL